MSDCIHRLCNYISNLFSVKHKNRPHLKIERQPSSYFTPPRQSSRVNFNNFNTLGLKRQSSYPEDLNKPIRLPPSTPLFRCSSQTTFSKFGPENSIPFRPQRLLRNRGCDSIFQSGISRRQNFTFAPELVSDKAIQSSIPDFCSKSSKSSFGDPLEADFASPLDGYAPYDNFFSNKNHSRLKNTESSHPRFLSKCSHSNSKIPVRNLGRCDVCPNLDTIKFPQQQRGLHTLNSRRSYSKESHDCEDTPDSFCIRSADVGNWIAYRTETNAKFEHVFKSISKKKKHTLGNLIDSTSHSQWIQLAGVNVDKEANMFKKFAGGRVVLTLGEYKFLIKQMCAIHYLDYWDVLRKMATFQDELHESFMTS